MSVKAPESGDVITKSSITSMHEEVRSAINDVEPDQLGRGVFNKQHLPSLVSASDFYNVDRAHSPPTQNSNFDEFGWSASTGWDDLKWKNTATDYKLTNYGAGWSVTGPSWLYMFCSLRVSTAVSIHEHSSGVDAYDHDGRLQGWFNLYYSFDGTDVFKQNRNRVVIFERSIEESNPGINNVNHSQHERTVTITGLEKLDPVGIDYLNHVGVYSAVNKGGSSYDWATNGLGTMAELEVKHGTIGFFLIPVRS